MDLHDKEDNLPQWSWSYVSK